MNCKCMELSSRPSDEEENGATEVAEAEEWLAPPTPPCFPVRQGNPPSSEVLPEGWHAGYNKVTRREYYYQLDKYYYQLIKEHMEPKAKVSALPEGWHSAIDPVSGSKYYHRQECEPRWGRPGQS